jgi:hypothetical protein
MSIPANFSGNPQEDPRHYFRKLIVEFKKTVSSTKDVEKLNAQIDRFFNVSKEMNWNHKNSGVYHKDEGEKAANKVVNEFRRYINALQVDPKNAQPQDLQNALSEIERLLSSAKVS